MQKRLPGPAARRISIVTLAGLIVLLAALSYRDYRAGVRQWHTAAENQASQMLRLIAHSIAPDLHSGDLHAAHQTLQQFLDTQATPDMPGTALFGLRSIELRDTAGRPLAFHGRDPASGRKPVADGAPGVSGPVLHGGRQLGSLHLHLDRAPLDRLLQQVLQGHALYLPGMLCGALLLTLIFAHWIMHPLRLATRVLPRIGEGHIALPDLTARHDEYADLGQAIEFADRRLYSQQADLVETQTELNRFKTTLDQTLDCVFMFKPENLQFFYTNAGAVRQVGYSADELNKMTVLDIKPEFDESRFRTLIAPLISGERDAITFETVHRHSNSSLVPVEISLQYIAPQDESGRFVAIVRDISERKRVEQELAQHRQQLEALVAERSATIREQARIINQTHDSVITTDLNGIVTSWNSGAERMFGIPAPLAVGRHISFVYPPDQYEYLEQEVISPLRNRGEHEIEVRMRRADGSEFFALLSLSMLYDDDGAPKGMVGYSIDISERKRREALLQTTTSRLEISNRELESFCYTVSHDLRAPLRTIHGFSQILSEDYEQALDEQARDCLRRIRSGAENMGRLIDDLLDLSRVTRRELDPAPVDLSAMAEQIIADLREREPQRRLEVSIQPGLTAMGDEGLLQIMLQNLLGNAWKYTGRTPDARLAFGVGNNGAEPEFYVRDNGAGFDMRYADKLFGTFERLHQASEFPGTGIGLATVQRIVTRHGGAIRGEGQPGLGACFYFSLPQQTPAQLDAQPA